MKGQAQILAVGGVLIVVVVMTLLGLLIYGLVSDIYPHEKTITNETLCTTCANSTLYTFDNSPVVNATLVCTNGSSSMVLGLDYNTVTTVAAGSRLNLTSIAKTYVATNCTYTHDPSNANEQSFYTTNTNTTFSGFALLSVAGIIIAAVAIILTIIVLKG